MRFFEPHAHMVSRTTDDYEAMFLAGVEKVCEPAFWLGAPRRHAGTHFDYFELLLSWERERARNHGLEHYCCLALNPREANDEPVAREVLAKLPEYLQRDGVVGVGEIGFDQMTDAEERAFRAQVELARAMNLPILVHTPHRHKLEGTRRILRILEEMQVDPEAVCIDHNTEETIELTRAFGAWAGHTVYPVTKLSPERALNIFRRYGVERMLVNGAPDWGPSDPLSVVRVGRRMLREGFARADVERLVWLNPHRFFRLDAS